MIKIATSKPQTKELFCQKYWKNILKNNQDIPHVGRFDFYDINNVLVGIDNKPSDNILGRLIKDADLVQRLFSVPLKNDIVLWRGIANPATLSGAKFNYIKSLFQKCVNLKEGNIFYMPEYSFWSDSKNLALQCANTSSEREYQGILYELTIPKGFNMYQRLYPVLKRYSKFLCVENKIIEEKNKFYNHIKLSLLPRDY